MLSCSISKASDVPRSSRDQSNAPTQGSAAAGATSTRHQNLVVKLQKQPSGNSCLVWHQKIQPGVDARGEPGFHRSAAHRRACSKGYWSLSEAVKLPTLLAADQRTPGTRCPSIPSPKEGHCSGDGNEAAEHTNKDFIDLSTTVRRLSHLRGTRAS